MTFLSNSLKILFFFALIFNVNSACVHLAVKTSECRVQGLSGTRRKTPKGKIDTVVKENNERLCVFVFSRADATYGYETNDFHETTEKRK